MSISAPVAWFRSFTLGLYFFALPTLADPLTFESEEVKQRFDQLTEELRCLVCQNQSLADSDATSRSHASASSSPPV